MSDWHDVLIEEVERTKEGRALAMIHSSFPAALRSLHPETEWSTSRFNTKLLATISEKLGVTQVRTCCLLFFISSHLQQPWDWYSVSEKEVSSKGGKDILQHYGSLPKALKALMSNITWEESKFLSERLKEFWNSHENNKRALMDAIGQLLGVRQVLCLRLFFTLTALLHIGVELSGGTLYQSQEGTKIMDTIFFLEGGPE